MRLRSAFLGLCVSAGCYTSPDGNAEFGGGGSQGLMSEFVESTGLAETTSMTGTTGASGMPPTSGPTPPLTGDAGETEEPAETSGEVDETTTGLDLTTTGAEVTTSDDTTTTGGPPADCPRVRINTPGDVANVRPSAGTGMDPVGTLAHGTLVDVLGVEQGEVIDGIGTWYHVQGKVVMGYVWGGLADCTLDEPFEGEFYLPLECGKQATISQGNNGDFSHQGKSAYAFDFSLGSGTPLVAVADGTVLAVYGGTMPGDPCYNGGGQECNNAANYVSLLHGDGTQSIYAHLSEPKVGKDQFVGRGTVVGLSGSTGWSTGPHAHVARTQGCGSPWCQSIEMVFADVGGDGIPNTGDVVVSGNCP